MENVGLMVALASAMTKAPSSEQVASAVDAWLEDHPEATTTVTDGAITNAKLASSFVTPGTAAAYSSSATYAVGDYVFYGGTLYRCITPITTAEAWTAAHWTAAALGDDVGDLKSATNEIEGEVFQLKNLTLSDYSTINFAIAQSNIWSANGKSKNIPVSANWGKKVTIKSNATNGSVVCFLKSIPNPITYGSAVDYATGTTRTFISANTTRTFTLPNDCTYINVLDYWSSDYLPSEIIIYLSAINSIQREIVSIESSIYDSQTIDFAEEPLLVGAITLSNKWASYGDRKGYFVARIDSATKLSIKANSTNPTVFAFLKSFDHVDESTPDYATGSGRVSVNAGNTYEADIPSDCTCVWFLQTLNDSKDYTPETASFYPVSREQEDEVEIEAMRLGLHTTPRYMGAINVVKRCRQMTDILWTPEVDLPRLMYVQRSWGSGIAVEEYEGVFKAKNTYKGIPYGRTGTVQISHYGYDSAWVGEDISIESFITAISNKSSIVSKESAFNIANHESTIYALVCSAFACYAIHVPYVATEDIPNISGLTLIGKINDNGTHIDQSNFKIGDLLNNPSVHTAVITDIIKDAYGNIQSIEICDASDAGLADKNFDDGLIGGVCRRKGWSIDQIYDLWGSYNILRYQNIKNIPYTPSPYVNVGGELDMFRIVHYPCMPYLGEGFKYKSGSLYNTDVVISPNLGYSYLRVFKDGTEITGSPFAVTSETEKVTTNFSGAGDYEAYLCNMSNGENIAVSCKCHWSVV